MDRKKLLIQVVVAALLFWIIKLILERDMSTETMIREGKIALVFGIAYAVFLIIRDRFRKKDGNGSSE